LHPTASYIAKPLRLIALLRDRGGSGIVYVATIKQCDAVARLLEAEGIAAERYHGRLSARVRHDAQDRFMAGGVKAIVATNAFGMGIDKPDIRFVVHYDMPGSLESYYQESGRAGRDGAPADCVLLYRIEDRRTHQFFMGGKYPVADDILAVRDALVALGADASPVTGAQVQTAATSVAKTKVRSVLAMMKDLRVVRELRGSKFKLTAREISAEAIETLSNEYAARIDGDREKLERMAQYAQSGRCRWKELLEYFGEGDGFDRCATCDNCVDPPELRYAAPVNRESLETVVRTHVPARD
jgi:ATP-dependent DNA helicase RecQ